MLCRAGTNTCAILAIASSCCLAGQVDGRLDDLHDSGVGLAHDDRIDDAGEWQWIREGKGTARDDERVSAIAITAPRGNAGGLQHARDARDLELVSDAKGQDWQLLDWPKRLVSDRVLRKVGGVLLAFVVEEGPFARDPWSLHERSVDALVTERAHSNAVGRGITEPNGERRLLDDAPDLVDEAAADSLAQSQGPSSASARSLECLRP